MATMVASGSQLSSPLPIQDKGQRNKRKLRTEPHSDSNKLIPPQMEYPDFDFSTEKSASDFNIQQHTGVCGVCTGLTCPSLDELEFEDYSDADWTEATEAQLEELLLNNLDMIFKGAILKIVSYGNAEDVATKVVLRSGICYGCKDTLSNIVDNALALLAKGKDIDSSKEHLFEDLQQLEKYVLAEMVCVLREVRPFFSTGDAMWCLLICDMNVSHACAMDCDPLNGLCGDERVCSSPAPQAKHESNINTSASTSISGLSPKSNKSHSMQHSFQISPQTQMPPVAGIPSLPSLKSSSSSNIHAMQCNHNQMKEIPLSSSDGLSEEFSCSPVLQTHAPEEKSVNNKKLNGVCPRRESILRQKPVHFDKNFRAYKSKGALRTGKMSTLGSLMLDKKCNSSDSTVIHLNSASMKKNKSVEAESVQEDDSPGLSFSAGRSATLPFSSKSLSSAPSLPTANTELTLSIPTKSKSSSNSSNSANLKSSTDAIDYQTYSGLQYDMMSGPWAPQDKKDEMMLSLVHRVRELQAQLQEWSDWAQQKVMQAARRLSKEKAELQTLRQEKEEASRVRKEKQSVEENTIKKLTEMESALSKASSQVEKANVASHSLEAENSRLRLEMEAAKLRAAESASICQEVSKREMETTKNAQSWEREKTMLREELMDGKKKFALLHEQVEQAKVHLNQLEGRCKQEEKVKEEVLEQASSVRKQREQIEACAKSREDAIICEAERDLQRHKDDVRELENQVEKLRINTVFSKAGALAWASNGFMTHRPVYGEVPVPTRRYCIPELVDTQEPGHEDVARDRECVMCLTEEMSVVFLPCAHQVVCNTCNDLHEKQGMKECPSCRTPIQRRISVRRSGSKP